MRASQILTEAARIVSDDRELTHGDKHVNHANIAVLWNAYLRVRREPAAPLSAVDVAHMMVAMKLARTQGGSFNLDDYRDMAGYAGCAGEIGSCRGSS